MKTAIAVAYVARVMPARLMAAVTVKGSRARIWAGFSRVKMVKFLSQPPRKHG